MSKYIDSLYKIHNNPFILTPLFVEFYSKSATKKKDVLLAYLLLPLVLNEASQKFIFRSNIRSSLTTFKENKENLYGLPERVERYKDITNRCLQYAIDNKYIKINKDLSVEILENKDNKIKSLNSAFKASSKLNNIFKNLDVVAIYRSLGVKEL